MKYSLVHLFKVTSRMWRVLFSKGRQSSTHLCSVPLQNNDSSVVLTFHLSVFKAWAREQSKLWLLGQMIPSFCPEPGQTSSTYPPKTWYSSLPLHSVRVVFFSLPLRLWFNHSLPQSPSLPPSVNLLQSNEKCVQYPRDRAIMTGKQ